MCAVLILLKNASVVLRSSTLGYRWLKMVERIGFVVKNAVIRGYDYDYIR